MKEISNLKSQISSLKSTLKVESMEFLPYRMPADSWIQTLPIASSDRTYCT
ncbi:hypothetical protein [Microcoleus sp. B4-D4]|uniref:hypothetical protein n=1 Tax=Microcoleus sp. B4-D4 TaxID=2818667 RepID=UPI002FD111FF